MQQNKKKSTRVWRGQENEEVKEIQNRQRSILITLRNSVSVFMSSFLPRASDPAVHSSKVLRNRVFTIVQEIKLDSTTDSKSNE